MSEPEEFMRGGGQRAGGYIFAAPYSAEASQAVKKILRTGRLARYRVLDVACPEKNHRLAQVLRTSVGLVVVGQGPITEYRVERHGGESYDPDHGEFDWEVEIEKRTRINRGESVCCLLDDLLPNESALLQCRCGTAPIAGAWFVEKIMASRKRVPYPTGVLK